MTAVQLNIKTAVPASTPEPSCKICVKADVCVILRALKGLADQFGALEGKSLAPFRPEAFAMICSEFLPPSGLRKKVVIEP